MPSTLTLRCLRPSLDEKIDAWSNVIIISGAMISAIYALDSEHVYIGGGFTKSIGGNTVYDIVMWTG